MPALEVFCGVFAVLAYRALFCSDRSLSLGSIVMLVMLSAALTQVITAGLFDRVVQGGREAVSDILGDSGGGGGGGDVGVKRDEPPPIPGLHDERGTEGGGADDMMNLVSAQVRTLCASGLLGSMRGFVCNFL